MTEDERGRVLNSDERVFEIVEALAEQKAGVTELANRLDVPKSTVHSHLSSLTELGYAVREDGQYNLSLKFLDIGVPIRNEYLVYQAAKPQVDKLAEKTDEKVWCMVEERGCVVPIYEARGESALQTNTHVGQHADLLQLAAGKAILAHLPQDRTKEIIRGRDEARKAENEKDIEAELDEIREQGVAYNQQEFIKSINGIGAPIISNSGEVHGAISISGPSNRLTQQQMRTELTGHLLGITDEIGVNLSYM